MGQEPADTPQMPVAEKNISAMVRLEQEALNHRGFGDRLGDVVTGLATRPWLIAAHVLVFALWIAVNTFGSRQFDPKPYNLLSTVVSLEAIFLTLLILASQHRMSRISDRRAHLNLQVDLLAEQEMTVMLRMLERLLEHLKLDPVMAPQTAELLKMTDVEALAGKLETRLRQTPGNAPEDTQ